MSKERLEKVLKNLKEARITNYEKIASFKKKLAYISNAPQEFQLDQEIKLAEKEIQDIDIRIESLEKEIQDIDIQIESLRKEIGDIDGKLPPPIINGSIIPISTITDENSISPLRDDNKDELDDKIEVDPSPPDQKLENHINLKGNYDKLSRLLLEEKEWKAADVETMQVILHIAEKTKEGWLTSQDIAKIPSEDLKKIDSLWLEASNRKFGYSVQRNIWVKIQYKSKNSDISINYDPSLFLEFAKQVGWRVNNNSLMNYDDFDFSLNAPDGHLPTFCCLSSTDNYMKWRHTFRFFLPRL